MSTVPLPPYDRPYLTFDEQVELLASRGMQVRDRALAAQHLERIGYYRLKTYWHPFRETRQVIGDDGDARTEALERFRAGTDFSHGVDLYVFDKKLRLLLTDAIERVEVALRVDIAHTLGQRDTWAHHDSRFLDPSRATKLGTDGLTRHQRWLVRADDAEHRSRADWLAQFRKQYSSPLPIWIAVELWEFGVLSKLLEIAHPADRFRIAQKYGVPNSELLVSWVKTLAYVRNVCAHHGRLWNLPLVVQPALPKQDEVPSLRHLRGNILTQTRVYAAAAIAQHMLGVTNPNSAWKVRLRALWLEFPAIPRMTPHQAGFLQNWGAHQLWQ